jgi:hypothetical protein
LAQEVVVLVPVVGLVLAQALAQYPQSDVLVDS